MIKQQNSSSSWPRIRLVLMLVLSVFAYTSIFFVAPTEAVIKRQPLKVERDPLTPEDLAARDCARYYTIRQGKNLKSCKEGYVGATDSKSYEDSCKNADQKEACKKGHQLSATGHTEDDEPEEASNASKTYCNARFPTRTKQIDQARLDKVNACKSGYEGATDGETVDKACEGADGDLKSACEAGANKGKEAVASGRVKAAKDSNPDEEIASNPDCDVSLGSPLSWIICPIVDLGAGFTDFVFTTFVRGLLEDVPITTDEGNGSYQAWKQFRVLGNIVLLGTLLAVVYSQVRSK